MMVLCIIFGIITIISLASFFLLLHDLKEITKQIDYKNKTNSHFDITVSSSASSIKKLQLKINELYKTVNKVDEIAFKKEKEMKTLISGLAHDIRTPLTSIKGYLKLIEESSNDKERKKYYDIIEYRLDTLASMLENLFIHSKISDSEYEVKRENIEIFPIICKVMASFYHDFKNRNIEPIIHFSNEYLKVIANQDMLTRMIHNLVSNALKHGCDYFEIKEKDNKIYFINKVKNSQQIEIERLFDRFYLADSSRHQNSTGLGLSIVKQIVEIHEWDISANMEDDKIIIILDIK